MLELCQSCLALENHVAASKALGILTTLVSYCYTENIPPPAAYIEQIELHIESLTFLAVADKKLDNELMQYLKYGVALSQQNEVFRDRFLEIVSSLVTDDSGATFVLHNFFVFSIFMHFSNFSNFSIFRFFDFLTIFAYFFFRISHKTHDTPIRISSRFGISIHESNI